jgi:hypothetical protein
VLTLEAIGKVSPLSHRDVLKLRPKVLSIPDFLVSQSLLTRSISCDVIIEDTLGRTSS